MLFGSVAQINQSVIYHHFTLQYIKKDSRIISDFGQFPYLFPLSLQIGMSYDLRQVNAAHNTPY